MLKRILHGMIRRFAGSYQYDATYLHEIIDISPVAALKFMMFQAMAGHRDGVPTEARFAASLAAVLSEDCGPCTQLVVDKALKAGVAHSTIAALLRGDLKAAGQDAELAFRYGTAVSQNTPDAASLAEDAVRRFGKRGRICLAYAVACGRVYPALKRGLGHAAACSKIKVSDEVVILKQAA